MDLLIFLALAITLSLLSHALIKRISIAILLGAVTTSVCYQLITYLRAGELVSYFPIIFLATFAVAFLIALVVGIPFKVWRRINN